MHGSAVAENVCTICNCSAYNRMKRANLATKHRSLQDRLHEVTIERMIVIRHQSAIGFDVGGAPATAQYPSMHDYDGASVCIHSMTFVSSVISIRADDRSKEMTYGEGENQL